MTTTTDTSRALRAALLHLPTPDGGEALNVLTDRIGVSQLHLAIADPSPETSRRLHGVLAQHLPSVSVDDLHTQLQTWAGVLDDIGGVSAGERDLAAMDQIGARLVTPDDPEWPDTLHDLRSDAPIALWVRGESHLTELTTPPVTITGSRAATACGSTVASQIAGDLSRAGVTTVTGGGFGIEEAVITGSLASASTTPTIVVTAAGLERTFPVAHSRLFEAVVEEGGLLLSENPPRTPVSKGSSQRRARLLAALGATTVIVEAGLRSGSRLVAHQASALGRPVGAVPGPVTSAASLGTHELLQRGSATMVTGSEDVLNLL